MRVNIQINTNSYKNNNPLYTANNRTNKFNGSADIKDGHISLKRLLTEANKEQKTSAYMNSNSILASSMSYSEKLKAQRENMRNASLEKKKLKYQFKDISSQIIRSKTSQTARQAVSSARRELLRLKQEKQSGKYDAEEVEAAINHAKAMERVARKKVRHLEEEELAKASGGPCADVLVEQEEKLSEDSSMDEELSAESYDDINYDNLNSDDIEFNELGYVEDLDVELEELEELELETFDELSESLQDMLEEMGLGELSDSLEAIKGDMDPEDLKMMKIKHRCKEMKEMTKADSEYLKAIFDHLEKQRDAAVGVPIGNTGAISIDSVQTAPVINVGGEPVASPSIDISL